ncbi:uncharacterized protein LOC135220992 [Macrobrachium nipponense]|uniref:uncharacterized protein LOC135220992 n=1 Tax=Macrobrachium nipponense TaxID=159736 RepID=UPI0030C8ADB3
MAEHTGTNLSEGSEGLKVEEGEPDTVGEKVQGSFQRSCRLKTEERVGKALVDVEARRSIHQAAETHLIGCTTVSKYTQMGMDASQTRTTSWLPGDVERDIVYYCLEMARMGRPQTKKSLPLVVQHILNEKKIKVFRNNNLPSCGWVTRFLKRHPELSNQISKNLGHFRPSITPENIFTFFQHLEDFLGSKGLNVKDFLSPDNSSRIFNCDETGIVISGRDRASKCLLKKGTQSAYKRTGKGKLMMTVLCCASADGGFMRPFIINKGKTPTVYVQHQDLAAESYSVGCSDTGRMTADLFHRWLEDVFEKELVKMNIKKPVLLFVDSHSSHRNFEAFEFALSKEIFMYYLPPHFSHIMQPLDVAVFKPLKESYRKAYEVTCGKLSAVDMPQKYFPYVLMKAIKESNLAANIKSGFRTTGLVPFNPNAIKLTSFVSTEKQDASPFQLQETSTNTAVVGSTSPEEIYKQGFIVGQRSTLLRLWALIPLYELAVYKTRKSDVGWVDDSGTLYRILKELQTIQPCTASMNPYAGQTQPVAVGREIVPFPQAVPSTSGLQFQPSSDISLPGPSGIASTTPPPGIAEQTSDTVRREILQTSSVFYNELPWKLDLKLLQLDKETKVKDPTILKVANSEDYIKYLEMKDRKKMLFEEKEEQRKREREAKKLATGSKGKGKDKGKSTAKKQRLAEDNDSESDFSDV